MGRYGLYLKYRFMRIKNLQHLALLLPLSLTLGSCATFHTPLSRSIFDQNKRIVASEDSPVSVHAEISDFDWPVDDARMTRGFLPNKRKPHLGLDLAAPKGTPILASKGGMVIYVGREFRGFGKMILIESGDGWATLYAHLDSILVAEGKKVRQGEVLGAMGRTGRATGVHLHFEIRKDRGPVDPLPLLPNGNRVAAVARGK